MNQRDFEIQMVLHGAFGSVFTLKTRVPQIPIRGDDLMMDPGDGLKSYIVSDTYQDHGITIVNAHYKP